MIICRKTKQQTAEIEKSNKSFMLKIPVTWADKGRITTDKNAPENDDERENAMMTCPTTMATTSIIHRMLRKNF